MHFNKHLFYVIAFFFKEIKYKIPQNDVIRRVSKSKGVTFFKTHFISILNVFDTFKKSSKNEKLQRQGIDFTVF